MVRLHLSYPEQSELQNSTVTSADSWDFHRFIQIICWLPLRNSWSGYLPWQCLFRRPQFCCTLLWEVCNVFWNSRWAVAVISCSACGAFQRTTAWNVVFLFNSCMELYVPNNSFLWRNLYIFRVQMLNLADILFPECPLEPFSETPVLYLWSFSATRLRLFEVRIQEWQLAASFSFLSSSEFDSHSPLFFTLQTCSLPLEGDCGMGDLQSFSSVHRSKNRWGEAGSSAGLSLLWVFVFALIIFFGPRGIQ